MQNVGALLHVNNIRLMEIHISFSSVSQHGFDFL